LLQVVAIDPFSQVSKMALSTVTRVRDHRTVRHMPVSLTAISVATSLAACGGLSASVPFPVAATPNPNPDPHHCHHSM
jgi:hypothetical protein